MPPFMLAVKRIKMEASRSASLSEFATLSIASMKLEKIIHLPVRLLVAHAPRPAAALRCRVCAELTLCLTRRATTLLHHACAPPNASVFVLLC
jgi:hypothetical protein